MYSVCSLAVDGLLALVVPIPRAARPAPRTATATAIAATLEIRFALDIPCSPLALNFDSETGWGFRACYRLFFPGRRRKTLIGGIGCPYLSQSPDPPSGGGTVRFESSWCLSL